MVIRGGRERHACVRPRLSRTTKRREKKRCINAFVNVKNWRIEKRYALLDGAQLSRERKRARRATTGPVPNRPKKDARGKETSPRAS